MSNPLVSIVLPVYNGSKYLDQSLRSCMEQTYKDIELIAVDDCSTDETPQILRKWSESDARIKVVRHHENKRLPSALNSGFSQARGLYFTWTSHDNMYKPQAIEKMVRFLEDHRDTGLVYTDLMAIDESGKGFQYVRVEAPELLPLRNVVLACFMYRREAWDVLGEYDPKMFLTEDYDYWLRIYSRYKVSVLHEELYLCRVHDQSLTSTCKTARIDAHLRVVKKNCDRCPDGKVKAMLSVQVAHTAKRLGKMDEARFYYRQARRMSFPIYVRRALVGPVGIIFKRPIVEWLARRKARRAVAVQ